jgi:hypothetical protein
LTHTVAATYFQGNAKYPGGGYKTVNSNVGSLIDLYNVKFFGLGTATYSSYNTLFVASDGTSSTAV